MAIVTINKKQFEKDIGKLDDKMQHQIAMFGTPIDDMSETEMHLEIFPNRPDLLSYHNFKRSFLAFIGKHPGLKEYKLNKPEKDYIVNVDSSVKDVRPYTVCAIIRDLKLDNERVKELIEIQEKLHLTVGRKRKKLAIGIYPLDKIKLPITFKAVEPDQARFVPLEMERELSGLEILQKHPTGKEYAHLLAGKARFPLFVDAENKVLSMPPIINSNTTGHVVTSTRDLFVECSGFDEETLNSCLNILVSTMAEMGGKVYQMEIKYRITNKKITPDFKPKEMKISVANVNKLLGTDFNEKQIKQLLEKMGHSVSKDKVQSPCWRLDLLHEVDLIEDVAIAYGYENFVPEIPEISTTGSETQRAIMKKKVSEILSGLGLLEVSNYHLTHKKDQTEKMNVPDKVNKFIEVVESKTDYTALRENLSHYLLKNLSENVDSEYPQKIFEIGRVFSIEDNKVSEKENLAVAITPGNFTEAKQVLEYLFRMIGLNQEISFREAQKTPEHMIEGRASEIFLGKKSIGMLGEVHPRVLSNWKIRMPVSLLEIDFNDVLETLKN